MSRSSYSSSIPSEQSRLEAQAGVTITKLYHGPDCAHIKDRETACSCTLPFPLELSKTEKPVESSQAVPTP